MKRRDRIKNKFGGLCAYSGTPLGEDWQVDYVRPVRRMWGVMLFPEDDCEENMVPCQKIINHYKHSCDLWTFRNLLLGGMHERLKKLPKNPRTEKSRKRKEYLLSVAGHFGITPENPFSGVFYFENHEQ